MSSGQKKEYSRGGGRGGQGGQNRGRGGQGRGENRGGQGRGENRGGQGRGENRGGQGRGENRGGQGRGENRGGHYRGDNRGGHYRGDNRGGHYRGDNRGGHYRGDNRGGHSRGDYRGGYGGGHSDQPPPYQPYDPNYNPGYQNDPSLMGMNHPLQFHQGYIHPQNVPIHQQNNMGYSQNNQGYSQNNQGYRQNNPGYPQNNQEYPQNYPRPQENNPRPLLEHPPRNSPYGYSQSETGSGSRKRNSNYHKKECDTASVKSGKSGTITTKDIVLYLLPRITCSLNDLVTTFKCGHNDAKQVVNRNKTLISFVTSASGQKLMELSPDIEICQHYLDDGCYDQEKCSKIHICIDYLVGSCKEKKCDFGHSLTTKHNLSIWRSVQLESCTDYALKSIMELVMSKRNMAVCEEYNYGQCSKAEKCWMLHICKEFIDKHDECKSDCNLNHDILMDQCSKVLKMHKIEVEDSRRDVLIRVQKMLEDKKNAPVITRDLDVEDDSPPPPPNVVVKEKSKACVEKPLRKKKVTSNKPKKTKVIRSVQSDDTPVIPVSFTDNDRQMVKMILNSLIFIPFFWNSSKMLKKIFMVDQSKIEYLVKQCKKLFLFYQPKDEFLVKLHLQILFCSKYNMVSNCDDVKCSGKLHICLDYIQRKCSKESCDKSHKLTDEHNSKVLQQYLLDGIPPQQLELYLSYKFPKKKLPSICLEYASGNCRGKCDKIHVCYDRLYTGNRCYNSECDLSHDLFSPRNKALIDEVTGNDLSDDQILSICSARLPYPTSAKSKVDDASPQGSNTEDSSEDSSDSDDNQKLPAPKKSSGVKKKRLQPTRKAPKPKDSALIKKLDLLQVSETKPEHVEVSANDTRCFNHQLIANVTEFEICLNYLEKSGNCDDQNCGKLHSRVSQHWQFRFKENWYNFLIPHSNQIERDYKDPSKNSSVLNRKVLEYGKTVFDKVKLKVMNTNDLTIDFDKMVVSSANTGINLPVHRISTKSVAETQSTFGMVYGWYFLDKLGKWIEYGVRDSTEDEQHFTTIGSKEIEYQFINKKESVLIHSERFDYLLSFTSMNQTNTTTKVERDVRRRPKFALVEKINPEDPFNLKTKTFEMKTQPKQTNRSKNIPASVKSATIPPSVEKVESDKYPKYWQNIIEDSVELVTVDIDSEEESNLIQKILFFIPNADVNKVIRVQNTFMWEKFSLEMDRIKKKSDKKNLNIQQLYYGTNVNNIQKISKRNFEWREDFADSGAQYGRGAYFYNSAAEAYKQGLATTTDPVQCPVVLAVAQVFIGSIVKGDSTMRKEPMVQSTAGSNDVRYHNTAVNDLDKPEIFVKFNKDEVEKVSIRNHPFVNEEI